MDKQFLVKIRSFFDYLCAELIRFCLKLGLFLLILVFGHGVFAAEPELAVSRDEHTFAPEHYQLRIVVHNGEPDFFELFVVELGNFNFLGKRLNVAENGVVCAFLVLVKLAEVVLEVAECRHLFG